MPASPVKVGLIFGTLLGLWHLGWALLVATNLAQTLMDFAFWIHFITPPYHVEPFTLERAVLLLVVTFAVGFIGGAIGASPGTSYIVPARRLSCSHIR
jgi:hypothetical protein